MRTLYVFTVEEENTFDKKILDGVKQAQESEDSEWLLPTRVICEATSQLAEYVEDTFIEKRIFALAKQVFLKLTVIRLICSLIK